MDEKQDICDHRFITISPGFVDPGVNAMCKNEWCTNCGVLRLVRQRDKETIRTYTPRITRTMINFMKETF